MAAKGVSVNRKREEKRAEVDLITPHGAQITVDSKRAEGLLARAPITFNDGVSRKYVRAGEDPTVEPQRTGASAPRKGTGANTGGE
jgi:hypothetical protein